LTDGRLVSLEEARRDPLLAAAANWLALATVAARLAGPGPALLLDIGSTTTDAVPLLDGRPIPPGRPDPDRPQADGLLYQGLRARLRGPPRTSVIAGSGRFRAREGALETGAAGLDVAEVWGPDLSIAACARALALLAEDAP